MIFFFRLSKEPVDNITQFVQECHTYDYNVSRCMNDDIKSCFDLNQEKPCSNYHYEQDKSKSFYSLSSEYNWVCDKAEFGSNVLVAQNIGIILTNLIMMQLSDTWGRSPTFHISNVMFIFFRLLAMHVTDHYWPFMFCIAAGSTFTPLGIRVAYSLGND